MFKPQVKAFAAVFCVWHSTFLTCRWRQRW